MGGSGDGPGGWGKMIVEGSPSYDCTLLSAAFSITELLGIGTMDPTQCLAPLSRISAAATSVA